MPSQNQFTGSLPVGYGAHKLLNVQSHKLLADMSSLEEEKLHDDILFEGDIDDEQKMFPEEFCDSDNANDIKLKKEQSFRNKNNREWYVSKALNDRITYLHIKRAIKIIIPREYVSRERSRRHIASNYLPGLEPINSDHNVQKYRFYAFKLSSGYHLGKIIFLEDQGNPVVSSNSANAHVTFRALILSEQGENQFTYSSPLKISRWLNIDRVYSEVHLTSINGGRYLLGKNSENIFREIQKKQLEFEDFMLAKSISSNVSLDYVEVEEIVDRKVDQLSHQYIYQVKSKGEIDLIWLNAHNFLEPVKYNKRRSRDNLPRKPQFAQKPEKKIKRKRKVEAGQSTIPTKIKKTLVIVIQSYKFGSDASLLVEEYGIFKELRLKPQDVNDVLGSCWVSDVHIHAAGILFKKETVSYLPNVT